MRHLPKRAYELSSKKSSEYTTQFRTNSFVCFIFILNIFFWIFYNFKNPVAIGFLTYFFAVKKILFCTLLSNTSYLPVYNGSRISFFNSYSSASSRRCGEWAYLWVYYCCSIILPISLCKTQKQQSLPIIIYSVLYDIIVATRRVHKNAHTAVAYPWYTPQ